LSSESADTQESESELARKQFRAADFEEKDGVFDFDVPTSRFKFEDVLLNSELVAKVELLTFAVTCRHQQETSEKLYFRGFSGELRTVFRKTSVGN
jgi:hypothetical protein